MLHFWVRLSERVLDALTARLNSRFDGLPFKVLAEVFPASAVGSFGGLVRTADTAY